MVYIMRHGKTDWNRNFKLQGLTDIPLNEEGRLMAQNARERYADVDFDVCFCSPLSRAKETAEIFLDGREVDIIPDDRLREMCFGIYEGTENSFSIPDCPINALFKDPTNYQTVEDGESFEELYKRTGEFLEEIVMPLHEQGKTVLIVGHGAMNCSIISQVRNTPLENFWDGMTANCQVVELLA